MSRVNSAVVYVIVDGVGACRVRPDMMPALHALAVEGAWRPDGSQAVLCSATYPNVLTLLTGSTPREHRIFVNGLFGGPAACATVFDRAPHVTSEIVVGDQHLIDVAGGRSAGRHWPPEGVLPPSAIRDEFGCAADAEVLTHAIEAAERHPDLLVVHINGPDTAAHRYGPDSPEAAGAYRSADATLSGVLEALRPRWDELLVLIASDHDQEPIDDDRRIDLSGLAAERGIDASVVHEGTAALVVGKDADDMRWLSNVPDIERSWRPEPEVRLVMSASRSWFATGAQSSRLGAHGGLRTRDQIAVATGGHPMVLQIAEAWRHRRPRAEDWAGLVLAALR